MLDDWLDGHVRFEPLLANAASRTPRAGRCRAPSSAGGWAICWPRPELGALMMSREPLATRREAAQLLLALPPRKETAAFFAQAAGDGDPIVADWAAVGAVRLGDAGARDAGSRDRSRRPGGLTRLLRIRAALALAKIGDTSGVPAMSEALDHCDDVLLCRLIIITRQLRDRRAVPALLAHLPEVQNRREMVDALGAIGDPAACDALVERLRGDSYVPVRVQAARALAKLGEPSVIPALERSEAGDGEHGGRGRARGAGALPQRAPTLRAPSRWPWVPEPDYGACPSTRAASPGTPGLPSSTANARISGHLVRVQLADARLQASNSSGGSWRRTAPRARRGSALVDVDRPHLLHDIDAGARPSPTSVRAIAAALLAVGGGDVDLERVRHRTQASTDSSVRLRRGAALVDGILGDAVWCWRVRAPC